MKQTILFLLFGLILADCTNAQIQFTAGVNYTAGVPTGAPSASGSRLRFNLATGRIYEWNPNTSAWALLAQGIDPVVGCVPPAYTPDYQQSAFAVNACDSLYYYRSGAWRHLNPGGGGDQTLSISGQDLSISNGNTVTLPGTNLSITDNGGDVIVINSSTGSGFELRGYNGISLFDEDGNIGISAGGLIGGSIANTQVAVGSGINTISGSNNFTYASSSLKVNSPSGTASFNLKSSGTTSATNAVKVEDSGGNSIFYLQDNGASNFGKVTTTYSSDVQYFLMQPSTGIVNFNNNGINIFSSAGCFAGELNLQGTGFFNNARGVNFILNSRSTNTLNNLRAGYFSSRIGTSTGRAANLIAVQGDAFSDNATGGTITNIAAFKAENWGTTNAGVTATNSYGLWVNDILNSGTTTNTYGVYIGDITAGTQTNKAFGVYSSDANARNAFMGQTGVGTAAVNASAALEVASTTQGVLFPRMTTTQRDAITGVNGLVIYNTTTSKFQGYAGGAWVDLH